MNTPLLHDLAVKSFLLVHSDWSTTSVLVLVEKLKPTHIIIQDTAELHYYLLRRDHVRAAALNCSGQEVSLVQALQLDRRQPALLFSAYSSAALAKDYSIVVDGERVIGVYDTLSKGFVGGYRQEIKPEQTPLVHLRLQTPRRVPVNTPFSIIIAVTWPNSDNDKHGNLAIKDCPIDIVLVPEEELEFIGPVQHTIQCGSSETSYLQFKLKINTPGYVKLSAIAFQSGEQIALVAAGTEAVLNASNLDTSEYLELSQSASAVEVQQPDLSLLIFEQRLDSVRHRLTFYVDSVLLNLNLVCFGSKDIQNPDQILQDHFHDIDRQATRGSERAIHIVTKGVHLFRSLFPEELQSFIWNNQTRIKNVLIQSQEPWIPWELCKLRINENGHVREGPFLCEAFAVTRWMLGVSRKHSLGLNRIGLVAPPDSRLIYAASEREYMLSLACEDRQVQVIQPQVASLIAALSTGEYDGWHFIGHGSFYNEFPDMSEIHLEHGDILRPENLSGRAENLGRARPIVFLNSCQLGRASLALTGIGGWAYQFLHAGAAAFIGAYWNIYDGPASLFAKEFYKPLFRGETIGEASRLARTEVKRQYPNDPSWLAYTIFADPNAKIIQHKEP